ncbi:MAG TPA: response regulator, partial [Propionibacteriaceae bacterium]|nr:response regulator [Propionibacteriaceae bacterium]
MSITVLLAEDQRMVLGALGSLLGLEPDIDIIDTATDGDEALRLVQTLQPDILLTDIEMPGRSGLDVAAE